MATELAPLTFSRMQTKFSDSSVTLAKEMESGEMPRLVSWTCSENKMGLSAILT